MLLSSDIQQETRVVRRDRGRACRTDEGGGCWSGSDDDEQQLGMLCYAKLVLVVLLCRGRRRMRGHLETFLGFSFLGLDSNYGDASQNGSCCFGCQQQDIYHEV